MAYSCYQTVCPTQLVKVIHPDSCRGPGLLSHDGQREESRSRRFPEASLGDSLLSNVDKWSVKEIIASHEQGTKPLRVNYLEKHSRLTEVMIIGVVNLEETAEE